MRSFGRATALYKIPKMIRAELNLQDLMNHVTVLLIIYLKEVMKSFT